MPCCKLQTQKVHKSGWVKSITAKASITNNRQVNLYNLAIIINGIQDVSCEKKGMLKKKKNLGVFTLEQSEK